MLAMHLAFKKMSLCLGVACAAGFRGRYACYANAHPCPSTRPCCQALNSLGRLWPAQMSCPLRDYSDRLLVYIFSATSLEPGIPTEATLYRLRNKAAPVATSCQDYPCPLPHHIRLATEGRPLTFPADSDLEPMPSPATFWPGVAQQSQSGSALAP
jgi:hypothetical protein